MGEWGIPRACVAALLSLQQLVTAPPFSERLTPQVPSQLCFWRRGRHPQAPQAAPEGLYSNPGLLGAEDSAQPGAARRAGACSGSRESQTPRSPHPAAVPMCPAPGSQPAARTATLHRAAPPQQPSGGFPPQPAPGCLPSLPLQAPSMGLWEEWLLSPGLPERGSQTRVEAIARPQGYPAGHSPAWAMPSPPCSRHNLSIRGLRERCLPPAPAAPQSACAPPLSLWDSSPRDPPHLLSRVLQICSMRTQLWGLSPQLLRASGEPRKGCRQTPLTPPTLSVRTKGLVGSVGAPTPGALLLSLHRPPTELEEAARAADSQEAHASRAPSQPPSATRVRGRRGAHPVGPAVGIEEG